MVKQVSPVTYTIQFSNGKSTTVHVQRISKVDPMVRSLPRCKTIDFSDAEHQFPAEPIQLAPSAPAPDRALSNDDLVIFDGETKSSFSVGRVVDSGSDDIDGSTTFYVHYYNSYIKGRNAKYKPVFIDPKDGKEVFTDKPLRRYEAWISPIERSRLIFSGFSLNRDSSLPSKIRSDLRDYLRNSSGP